MRMTSALTFAFLLTVAVHPAGAVSYSYDKLNRLTGVTYDDGSSISYQYDATGNITSENRSVSPTQSIDGACGSANGASFGSPPGANLCSAGSASLVVGSGPWQWLCRGGNGGGSSHCSAAVSLSPHTLAISLAGSGSGTVNATAPPGLQAACSSNCSATVPHGAAVTLVASEAGGSTFTGWTSCDSVAGKICDLIMNSDRNPMLTFTMQQNLRIGATYYGTLQAAFSAVANGQTVQARNLLLPSSGSAVFSRSGVRALLKGGYGDGFGSTASGLSIFDGTLRIRGGTLVVERFAVR